MRGLRQRLGAYETVWGVKNESGALSLELYFYDYEREERAFSFAEIMGAMAPAVRCAYAPPQLPYFMASVNLPLDAAAYPFDLTHADFYIGNPGSTVSSGICYQGDATGMELKNFYFFFDRRAEWDAAMQKLTNSAYFLSALTAIEEVLPGWLTDCEILVVANKRRNDAVYASRVTAATLARFLKAHGYPRAVTAHLEENLERYRHLLFDVGYDYQPETTGVSFPKSSFYNVF